MYIYIYIYSRCSKFGGHIVKTKRRVCAAKDKHPDRRTNGRTDKHDQIDSPGDADLEYIHFMESEMHPKVLCQKLIYSLHKN